MICILGMDFSSSVCLAICSGVEIWPSARRGESTTALYHAKPKNGRQHAELLHVVNSPFRNEHLTGTRPGIPRHPLEQLVSGHGAENITIPGIRPMSNNHRRSLVRGICRRGRFFTDNSKMDLR